MSKVVLITGVSSGLGQATAYYLANKGHKVYGTSRFKQEAPINFTILKLDVLEEDSVNEVVDDIVRKEGRIDVLINNAGIGFAGAVEDTTMEEIRQQMETNFFGLVRMTKAVLPQMRAQKGGLIINIGSLGGRVALPFQAFYASSKFAIQGFTESLRMELMPFNIKMTVVNPGDFKTSFTTNRNLVKGALESSPYFKQFEITKTVIEEDEDAGADPTTIAKLIYKVINTKNPKISYQSGHFYQRFLVALKPIFPSSWIDYALRKYYKIGK